MSILCDTEIAALCDVDWTDRPMITPFIPEAIRAIGARKVISFGLSCYGYDIRLSDDIKIFTNLNAGLIDPKRLDPKTLADAEIKIDEDGARYAILPPNSYMLGVSLEHFIMPRDVVGVCTGKSTYARAAALVNVTPLEAEWTGQLVVEISNSSSLPMKIYVDEGIAQIMFHRGTPCAVSYADKGGKYQDQSGVQLPLV